MHVKYSFIVYGALFSLAACGFHLRGAQDGVSTGAMPAQMQNTHIQSVSRTNDLVRSISKGLASAGVRLTNSDDASAVLTIEEELNKQPLSYDAQGQAVEYEIFYTVRFSARRTDTNWEIPQQHVVLSRSYFFDRLDALAADRQEQLLRRDMQREAARLVLDRIRAAGSPEQVK